MNLASYKQTQTAERKLMDVQTAMTYYSLGRNRLMDTARQAGAVFYVGRKPLVNTTKMDKFVDAMTGRE